MNKGKTMNSNKLYKKALSLCLTVALLATYSMTALAATSGKVTGQVLVSGKNADAFVKINGAQAKNGSSISSSSTIATPEDASAIIDLGKIGKIELAPKTTLALTFSEKSIAGDLLAGQVTVLNASQEVSLKTLDGKIANLKSGESLTAGKAQDDDDEDEQDAGSALLIWGLIVGGAVAVIIYAATRDSDVDLGGNTIVVSPSR
jgi:hypothetical protein